MEKRPKIIRRKTIKVTIMLFFLLQACGGKEPKIPDLIGTWKSSDGSEVVLNNDGTFTEKSFPAEFVLLPRDKYKNIRFDGIGKWEFKKENSYWEVYLDFEQVSDSNCRSSFPLLIAGETGFLDNKPPWFLFVWKEEEGGERYKFSKQ